MTIAEPRTEMREHTYQANRAHFIAGRIGEQTFRVTLRILGLCPMDIDAEVHLAKMEKRRP